MQSNKDIVRQVYERAFNERHLELLDKLVDPSYTGPDGTHGSEGFARPVRLLIQAFPDIHYEIQDMVAGDDQVAIRWIWTGTQTGAFRDIPATNRKITQTGMAIYTLKSGLIAKVAIEIDRLSFQESLRSSAGTEPAATQGAALKPSPGRPAEEVVVIDKFEIPADAWEAFYQRMQSNRSHIRTLPGFLGDEVYECPTETGGRKCITIARWADSTALQLAKDSVQAEYARTGFDPGRFMDSLHIRLERGIFRPAKEVE